MKDMLKSLMKEKESKSKGKIESIHITKAENGWQYGVSTDKMQHENYVYTKIEDLLSAIKDDLSSPHIRKLTAEKAGKILHDKSIRGHELTKKQKGFFGAISSGKSKKLKDLMA